MSNYMKKLLSGQTPSADDWRDHLLEAHAKAPSMSPMAFADCRNSAGLNSYEWLALSVAATPKPELIVDLACGDGFLIPLLQACVPHSTSFLGVDMSEDELGIAQRKGLERTSFKCSTADQTGLPEQSADLVFCHMAFMLMLPVEPVIDEIYRILRPGGAFAATIGSASKQDGLFSKIEKVVGHFLGTNFSKMAKPITGDSRVQTDMGLRQLLKRFRSVEISTDSFEASLDATGVWDHIKNMYLIGGLPAAAQTELQAKLAALFQAERAAHGALVLDFPVKKLVATK